MAFPVTSPLAGALTIGNWSTNPFHDTGTVGVAISGGQIAPSGANNCEAWYNAATFGVAEEVFATVPTFPADNRDIWLVAKLQQPSASVETADCYEVNITVRTALTTDTWSIVRGDNGVFTQLGATVQSAFAPGDSFGLECDGVNAVTAYKQSGSTWSSPTSVLSRTDTTYQSATGCFLSLGVFDSSGTTVRFSNFGGGTISSAVDATTTAPVADGTGASPAPAMSAGSSATAPVADGTGAIPPPSISGTASADVTAPPSDGTGAVPAPTVSGTSDASVTATPASGAGDVLSPSQSADSESAAPPADGTGAATTPDASGTGSAEVVAPAADATGDVAAPTASTDATVQAPAADGTGDLPPTNDQISAVVTTGPVSGTGDLADAEASGTGDAEVVAPVADGSGDVPAGSASAGASVTAVPADASGDVLDPNVATGQGVFTPAASGAGDMAAPAVSATSEVVAPPADGSGDVPSPSTAIGATVSSPTLGGSGDVRATGGSGGKILPRIDLPTTVVLDDRAMTTIIRGAQASVEIRPRATDFHLDRQLMEVVIDG